MKTYAILEKPFGVFCKRNGKWHYYVPEQYRLEYSWKAALDSTFISMIDSLPKVSLAEVIEALQARATTDRAKDYYNQFMEIL